MSERFCVNCLHFSRPPQASDIHGICLHLWTLNLVSGNPTHPYCDTARGPFGGCGTEGKLFEPKDAVLEKVKT